MNECDEFALIFSKNSLYCYNNPMDSSKKSWAMGGIGLIWCFGIILLYYVSHKPITIELVSALVLLIWRLAAVFMLVSIAGGIGLRFFRFKELHPLTRLAMQAALGLGAMSLLVFIAGVFVGIPKAAFWLAPLGLAAIFWRSVLAWWKLWGAWKNLWQQSGKFGRGVGVLLGCGAFFRLMAALAPPLKFDALVYHLALPELYLRGGWIESIPSIVMSGMPQNAELLYTWVMALGGGSAATVLGWGFGFLTVTGLVGYICQKFDSRTAWAGLASLLAGFTLLSSFSWGYVDWLVMLFGFGALVCPGYPQSEGWP